MDDERVEWAKVTHGEALKTLALEVRRINAEGGKWGKDELAKELYNEASPMHDWDNMKPWGGLGVEERKEQWRRVAEHVDGMMDDLFPSLAACEAADGVLAHDDAESLAELREQDREAVEGTFG